MSFSKKLEDRIYERIMYSLEQRLDGCSRLFLFTKLQEEYSTKYSRGIPLTQLRPVNANQAIEMILDHLGMKLSINEEKTTAKDILLVAKDEDGTPPTS